MLFALTLVTSSSYADEKMDCNKLMNGFWFSSYASQDAICTKDQWAMVSFQQLNNLQQTCSENPNGTLHYRAIGSTGDGAQYEFNGDTDPENPNQMMVKVVSSESGEHSLNVSYSGAVCQPSQKK